MIKVEDDKVFSNNESRLKFHQKLRKHNLAEGYSYDEEKLKPRPYWPTEPKNDVLPYHWKWETLSEIIRESGELVGLGHGKINYDRRVIALTNPGLENHYAITTSFFADFQYIRPGEGTPSHRHTPCAVRFIFEGKGWTTVGNENVDFEAGDIIFTGQFAWHNHGNRSDTDLLFLDVLDIPLLQTLGVSKWEFDYWSVSGSKDVLAAPYDEKNYDDKIVRRSDLRFCGEKQVRQSEYFNYLRFKEVREILLNSVHKKNPYDGVILEFTNSATQGAVGPTMSVFTQMFPPNEKTREHRHTSQTIYVGVEGRGKIYVEDKVYEWGPHDVIVVPSWMWHKHENSSATEPCFIHSISDASLISKINLFREQRKLADGTIEDTMWTTKYFE